MVFMKIATTLVLPMYINRSLSCMFHLLGKCTRTNERGDETVEGVNSDRYCLGCGDSDDDVERGL